MWRGIREMDIILRDFAWRELASMPPADLDLYNPSWPRATTTSSPGSAAPTSRRPPSRR